MKIQINESPLDRAVRIVLGVALLALGVAGMVTAPIVYATTFVAVIALATGIVGFCPLYAILRLSTATAKR
jgi:hypothetical protein